MDPWHFLIIAERLRASDLEAGRRSSISRSYYAIYNEIVSCLRDRQVTLPQRDAHEKLCRFLAGTGHEVMATIGEQLRALRDDRNEADYDLAADPARFSTLRTERALRQARSIRKQFVSVGADTAAGLLRDYLRRTGQMP